MQGSPSFVSEAVLPRNLSLEYLPSRLPCMLGNVSDMQKQLMVTATMPSAADARQGSRKGLSRSARVSVMHAHSRKVVKLMNNHCCRKAHGQ